MQMAIDKSGITVFPAASIVFFAFIVLLPLLILSILPSLMAILAFLTVSAPVPSKRLAFLMTRSAICANAVVEKATKVNRLTIFFIIIIIFSLCIFFEK